MNPFFLLVVLSAVIWAFSQPSLSAWLPPLPEPKFADDTPAQVLEIAHMEATINDFFPELIKKQVIAESGGHRDAVSPAGAIGVAQIIPSTARAWGVDPRNSAQAIHAMVVHMKSYYRTFRRKGYPHRKAYACALAVYNAGAGAVAKRGCYPYAETRAYIARILH